jgi:hypothetical protein
MVCVLSDTKESAYVLRNPDLFNTLISKPTFDKMKCEEIYNKMVASAKIANSCRNNWNGSRCWLPYVISSITGNFNCEIVKTTLGTRYMEMYHYCKSEDVEQSNPSFINFEKSFCEFVESTHNINDFVESPLVCKSYDSSEFIIGDLIILHKTISNKEGDTKQKLKWVLETLYGLRIKTELNMNGIFVRVFMRKFYPWVKTQNSKVNLTSLIKIFINIGIVHNNIIPENLSNDENGNTWIGNLDNFITSAISGTSVSDNRFYPPNMSYKLMDKFKIDLNLIELLCQ